MHQLELKQRSYGRLKTTASSCAKISQLRNEIHLRNFARCFVAAKPPPSTRVALFKLKLHLRSCEPRCKIHLCKLRYLPPTKLDFFLKIFCVNFYFLLVISQRYYSDISKKISSLYIYLNQCKEIINIVRYVI